MKNRRIISALLAFAMALSFAGCGNSGSGEPTEKDFDKAAEKLDNMTDEDFEKAAEQAFGEDEPSSPSSEKKDTFEPCQEILEADFTSGLIQIGDDVFKCGGYLTVNDFINQYGSKYNLYADLNKNSFDANKELSADENEGCFYIENKENKIFATVNYCKHGKTIGEAVAYNFSSTFAPPAELGNNNVVFYPKGIKYSNPLDTIPAPDDHSNIAFDIMQNNFITSNLIDKSELSFDEKQEIPNGLYGFFYIESFRKFDTENNSILYEKSKSFGNIIKTYASMTTLKDTNLFGYNPQVVCRAQIVLNSKHFSFSYLQFELNDLLYVPNKPV